MPSNHPIIGQDFPEDIDLSDLPIDLQELADQLTCDADHLNSKLASGQLHEVADKPNPDISDQNNRESQTVSKSELNLGSAMSLALKQPEFETSDAQVEQHKSVFEQERKANRIRWWKVSCGMIVGVFVLGVGVQTARLIDQHMPADNMTDANVNNMQPVGIGEGNLMTIGQSPITRNANLIEDSPKVDPIPAELENCFDAEMEGWLDVKDETREKAIKF